MPVITKITTQKRTTDRYNIFIDEGDGEKFGFSVDEDVLIKFNLKKGLKLENELLTEIKFSDQIRQSMNLAINQLARRIRSEGEIRDYLRKKEMEDPIINEVIHKLAEMGYINDEEFTRAYVRTQVNTTDKGPGVIRRELLEKGIKGRNLEIIDKEYTWEKQVDQATVVAKKYVGKNRRDSKRMLTQKTKQLLMRKGYSQEVIALVTEEITIGGDAEEEAAILRPHGEKAKKRFAHLPPYEAQQKIKQTLFRRGFSIDLIDAFLKESEE